MFASSTSGSPHTSSPSIRARAIFREHLVKVARLLYVQQFQAKADFGSSCVEIPTVRFGGHRGTAGQDPNARDARHNLFQELELLEPQIWKEKSQPRDIPAGPGHAGDDSGLDGIFAARRHDDRDCRGGLSCRRNRAGGARHDDVGTELHELTRKPFKSLTLALRVAILQSDILAVDPSVLPESALERLARNGGIRVVGTPGRQNPDDRRTCGNLATRDRADAKEAQKKDENYAPDIHSQPALHGLTLESSMAVGSAHRKVK